MRREPGEALALFERRDGVALAPDDEYRHFQALVGSGALACGDCGGREERGQPGTDRRRGVGDDKRALVEPHPVLGRARRIVDESLQQLAREQRVGEKGRDHAVAQRLRGEEAAQEQRRLWRARVVGADRERGVDQHQGAHAIGREQRCLHRRPAERVEYADDAPALVEFAIARRPGTLREAERRQVKRDGARAGRRERAHRLAPGLAPGAGAVDENDRQAVGGAGLLHEDLDVRRLHEASTGGRRLCSGQHFAARGLPAEPGENQDHRREQCSGYSKKPFLH